MPIDRSDTDFENIDLEDEAERALRVQSAAGVTGDVTLTDASERFITQDNQENNVSGAGGDDVLVSAGGDDDLRGGDGADVLKAGSGADTLSGGAGNDILTGGGDADQFIINASDFEGAIGAQSDIITDFESGVDRLQIAGFDGIGSFADLNFLPVASGLAIVLGDNRFIVLEGYTSQTELSEADFEFPNAEGPASEGPADPVELTDENDRFVLTGDQDNEVSALDGDDAVVTAGGNDLAIGGDGSDVLITGDGEDTLVGGADSDVLTGGADSDLFRFALADFTSDLPVVADIIKDFEVGVDKIELTGFGTLTFDNMAEVTLPVGMALQVADNRYIVFEGIDAKSDLSEADFTFLGGEDGIAPEIIDAELVEDTGIADGVTNDPAIAGSVEDDDGTVTGLEVSVNGSAFVDVSSALDGADGFLLSAANLATAFGAALPQGALVIDIRAIDDTGLTSSAATINTTFDTIAPSGTTAALATTSDTGTAGDGITSLSKVKIVGEGEAGAIVSDGAVSTIVANDGTYSLSGVDVPEGTNDITLTTTDGAGNSSSTTLEITGLVVPAGSGPVLIWNDIALEAIADNAANPLEASRVLAMQSVAVYDVIAALDGSQAFLVDENAPSGASLGAAIAVASHGVLKYAFPAFEAELDAYLAEALATIPDGASEDDGAALGQAIAASVIAVRDADGWDDFETFSGGTDAGQWRETGPLFNVAIDPQYATMDTWLITGPDQFRPDGPAALTSAQYTASLAEVQEIGSIDSTTRTADQTEAARFWKDGLGTETTPGHWNSIATDHLKGEGLGAAENARALAMLNVSMADAMIASWDSKYEFGFWRPETAIENADDDGNANTIAQPDWAPLMLSPAHPEYTSGHGSASGAAAEVLTELFGEQSFTTESKGLAGISRSFDSYWQAAQENADSRLWGGVHFGFSNQDGLDLGRDVADWAIQAFNTATDLSAPVLVIDVSFGFASVLPFEINGAALDTLSGVQSVELSINDGDFTELSVGDDGSFSYTLDGVPDGEFILKFVATDAAGNVSRTVTSEVVVDRLDPIVDLTSLNDDDELEGNAARLSGSVDGTGSAIIALAYQIDDGKTTTLNFNRDTGAFDSALNLASIGIGDHTVTLRAVDAAGNILEQDIPLTLTEAVPFIVTEILPDDDATEVGSTFRPEIHFSRPVDPATADETSIYATDASGDVLPATVALSPDGTKAWLFFDDPLPGSTRISVTVEDSVTATDGTQLNSDGDGTDGSDFSSDFVTVSTTAAPNTSISGFIVDPGDDLKPMTIDDYSAGPDGADYTDDDMFLSPIEGATVWILGQESIQVTTDENGFFELTSVPAGNVKIAVDGRTATNTPDGIFWPEMVMDANIIAGQANTIMASMGDVDEREAVEGRGEVYLPRVSSAILQDVSETEATEIEVPVEAAQDLTEEQRTQIKLVVQPGTALDESGDLIDDAQVGISTVPPELVMDMLPEGIMQHTFDLTIQAPGAAVFTEPAELTLPNVFDAPPGTKLNLLSFDHTTGRLVIEGTATVSPDGETVTTDPGTGITKPGWHGMTPPGGCGGDGAPPEQPPEETPEDTMEELADELVALIKDDGSSFMWEREWEAKDALEDSPPPPPGEDECDPPAPPEDTEESQPDIKVTITVDGPLGDFLKAEADVPTTGLSFVLKAGTGDSKKFELSAKTFEELVTGGMKKIEENMLFGSKVTITEVMTNPDGSTHTTKQDVYFTRYVDATDDMHENGETEFNEALVDNVMREVPLKVMGPSGMDVEVASTTHFQASTSKLTFDPNATGEQITDLKFKYSGGVEVAETITLKGEGKDKQKIFIDEAELKADLQAIGTGSNATVTYTTPATASPRLQVTATELALIDDKDAMGNAVDETGTIASAVVARVKADYAGYDGIEFVSAGGAGVVEVSFNIDANQLYGYADQVDFDKTKMTTLFNNRADYSKAELYFRMDELINETDAGTVNVHAETFLEFFTVTSSAALIKSYADTAAHEAGHTLGLAHTYKTFMNGTVIKTAGVGPSNGSTDIMMGHAGDPQGALSFTSATDDALKLLSNDTYAKADAKDAFDYYFGQIITAGGFSTPSYGAEGEHEHEHGHDHGHSHGEGEAHGSAPSPVDVEDPTATPTYYFEGPHLILIDDTYSVGFENFDFGEKTVGSSDDNTRQLELFNGGSEDVLIDGVTINGAGFTIEEDLEGVTIPAGDRIAVTLEFDPDMVGDATGSILIASNGSVEPLEIELVGQGVSQEAAITVSSENSNFGGVDRGETQSEAEMFTISNGGIDDLVVSAISLADAVGTFDLLGLPADFPGTPITLAQGETFEFGVSFRGVEPGISRGAISITSNDPNAPVTEVAATATSFDGNYAFDWGNDYIAVDIDGQTLRTKSDENGSFELFLPAEEAYKISVFDPETGLLAVNYGTTSISGRGTDLTSGLVFLPSTGPDRDFDGLTDEIEHAIGTSAINADSDDDGISDFNAIEGGIEPLDSFSTNTGIVTTLPLEGGVIEIFATGALDDDGNELLHVVTSAGIGTIDVSEPREPQILGFADDLGSIRNAAYDPTLSLMVVVGTDGTVTSYDMTDPVNPVADTVLTANGKDVVVFESSAVVAVDGSLLTFELATGEELDSVTLGSASSIRGLTNDGNMVYAFGSSGNLHVLELFQGELLSRGEVALSLNSQDRNLFAADGVVYVPASNNFTGGYITVDVSDPNTPELLSLADDTSLGGNAIALNGAGRGLVVGDPGGVFGTNAIDVVDTSDPTETGMLITRYEIGAEPTAVSIASGVGYVGDATGQLHVVNFQPFDTNGVAPIVTLDTALIDQDPETDGVQILEGTLQSLNSMIFDDVGLRDVSLLIDGEAVSVDVTFPFDLFAQVPLLDDGEASRDVTIQVRAVDTGGNVGLSEALEATIVPDTVAPILADTNVEEGALLGRSARTFTFNFNESLDPAGVTSENFALSGPTGIVEPELFQLRSGDRSVTVVFDTLPEGAYSFTLSGSGIQDVAGNIFGDDDTVISFEIGTFTNEWIGGGGNLSWNNPDNWLAGRVPEDGDDLFIGVDGDLELLLQSLGDVNLSTIVAEDTIRVSFGTTLTIDADAVFENLIVQGGTVVFNGDAEIANLTMTAGLINGPGTINVTENLDWQGGRFEQGGDIIVENGAFARFGSPFDPESAFVSQSNLNLYRDLLLEGDGQVGGALFSLGTRIYDSVAAEYNYFGGLFTIAPGAELELQTYRSDFRINYTDADNAGIDNQGTILKTGGGTSNVTPAYGVLGTVITEDGFIAIGSGSTLVLSSQADLEGLSNLRVVGGTIQIDGDISLETLDIQSGTLTGDGDLTIMDELNWTGGEMRGDGDVVISDAATMRIGEPYDPETFYYGTTTYLYRNVVVEGDVIHEGANVFVGGRIYDPELQQYINLSGTFTIGVDGTYTFNTPRSEMLAGYLGLESGIVNGGTVIKDGGGDSGIVFAGDQTGSFSLVDGVLEITAGILVVTQETLNSGLDRIQVAGGTVQIDEDLTLQELIIESGTVTGTGRVAVNELDWIDGTVSLSGGLVIPEGESGSMGRGYQEGSTASSQQNLYTSIDIEGTLDHGGARTWLGTRVFDTELGQYINTSGQLILGANGVLNLNGPASDFSVNFSDQAGVSGISGSGTLVKQLAGTSDVTLTEEFTGELQVIEGLLRFSNGTTNITAEMVAAGLSDIVITGGTVVFDEDVSLNSIRMEGGTLSGDGGVTVTGSFDWIGGTIGAGGDFAIATGATAQFGYPIEQSTSTRALNLQRELTIDGVATQGNANMTLGRYYYDSDAAEYKGDEGSVVIGAGGVLDFRNTTGGIFVGDTRSYDFSDGPQGIANYGTITKSLGSNETYLDLAINEGSVGADFGSFYTYRSEFVVDQNTDTSVFNILRLATGTVVVAEDVSVDYLNMDGGELTGPGDLTITGYFDWSAGTMSGAGSTIIDSAGTVLIGNTTVPDNPALQTNLYLTRDLDVEGDAQLEAGRLRLGDYYYDSDLAQYVNTPGKVNVNGGTLRLEGEYSDLLGRFTALNGGVNENFVVNNGTVIKSGGGTSSFTNGAGLTGSGLFLTEDGAIELGNGTTLVVTAGMLVSDVRLNGGTIVVDANGTIANLEMISGTLTGDADLTISESLIFQDGQMQGTGKTIVGPAATALFGAEEDFDGSPSNFSPAVGRTLEIAGTAKVEQATVYMGANATPDESGEIIVLATGTLELSGARSDFINWQFDAAIPNAITNEGTITKTGGGTATVATGIVFTNNGTVTATDGQIVTDGATFGSVTPADTVPTYATSVVSGQTLTLTAADGETEVTVNGGTLIIDEDVTLTNLSIINGVLSGAGDVTVTGQFWWEGGDVRDGGGALISSGEAILGAPLDPDAIVNHGALDLGRTLEIQGTGILEQAELRLGINGSSTPAVLEIAAGASFTERGWNSEIRRFGGVDSEIIINGDLIKDGGGISDWSGVISVSGMGGIIVTDGTLRINSGVTVTLTDQLELTGIENIELAGGTLVIADNLTLTHLNMTSGTILGDGDLTITQELLFVDGIIRGSGDLILADGSSSVMGRGVDELNVNSASTPDLGRELQVDGDLIVARGDVYMGTRIYDTELAQFIVDTGLVNVSATGTLELWGTRADFRPRYAEEGEANTITIDGTLIKTGGGESNVPNLEIGLNGAIDLQEGSLVLTTGEFVLTNEIVAQGFENIILDGATLIASEDLSIASLTLRNGSIEGAGDLTITEGMSFINGALYGPGELILAAGSDSFISDNNAQLGREITVDGVLDIASRSFLGAQRYDVETNAFISYNGSIGISDTGTLKLSGVGSEIYNNNTTGMGVTNAGTITLDPIANHRIPLSGDQTGTFELNGTSLVVPNTSIVTLTTALIDLGITSVLVESGGVLIIDEDLTLDELIMNGGQLYGSGELTVSGNFDWNGGSIGATNQVTNKVVLADSAEVQFGNPYDPDAGTSLSYLQLNTEMEIQGSANMGPTRLDLGAFESYDSVLQQNVYKSGVLTVAPSAVLTIDGPNGNLNRENSEDTVSGVVNDGTIIKTGGGTTPITLLGGTGSYEFENGSLVLNGGETEITQELIDAGFDRIVVEGGTVNIAEELTLETLDVINGSLVSNFDLNVTESLTWSSGSIDMGDNTLTIAASATASLGQAYDPEVNTSASVTFSGDMDIAGTVLMQNTSVRLGFSDAFFNDQDQYVTVNKQGTFDVLTGGTLEMEGPVSGFTDQRYLFSQQDSAPIETLGVNNQGTIRKTGGGESELILYGDNDTGIFEQANGDLVLESSAYMTYVTGGIFGGGGPEGEGPFGVVFAAPPDTVVTLPDGIEIGDVGISVSAAMVANGLSDLVAHDALLIIPEDITLNSLDISGNGSRIDGTGSVTILSELVVENADLMGTGTVTISEDALALIGRETDADSGAFTNFSSIIGRDIIVDGTLRIEQSRVALGDGDFLSDPFDEFDFGSLYSDNELPGTLNVTQTGTLELFGPLSDVTLGNDPVQDDTSGVILDGTLVKLGGGLSTIEDELVFQNNGTITLVSGQLDAPGTDNDFGF